MKVSICDICDNEGKFIEAKFRTGFKNSVKVDLCAEHKDIFKSKTAKDFHHELHTLLAK